MYTNCVTIKIIKNDEFTLHLSGNNIECNINYVLFFFLSKKEKKSSSLSL